MARIHPTKHADGSVSYWIMDKRDGHQIVIPAGITEEEAKRALTAYEVRRDLEKEGYFDIHQELIDQLWGAKDIKPGKLG